MYIRGVEVPTSLLFPVWCYEIMPTMQHTPSIIKCPFSLRFRYASAYAQHPVSATLHTSLVHLFIQSPQIATLCWYNWLELLHYYNNYLSSSCNSSKHCLWLLSWEWDQRDEVEMRRVFWLWSLYQLLHELQTQSTARVQKTGHARNTTVRPHPQWTFSHTQFY